MLEICTLGDLTIRRDGAPVTELVSRKVEVLLVYLACTGRPHAREVLAELLWPGRSQERAQGNLRVALASLRKHLGPYVTISRQTVALNPDAGIRADALEFEQLVVERPEAALELYQGAFLEGMYLRDAPDLEQWIVQERERLQRMVVMALHKLVDADVEAGRWELGLAFAGQLLGLDPLDEAAHRQMMRLLTCSDQRAAALAQYEACRRILDEELGVAPGAETVRLYEQIRDGEFEVPTVAARPAPGPPPFVDSDAEKEPYHPPLFVARERELAWLEGFLDRALAGQGQVVFVSGGPGRGKTALLDAFARWAMDAHPGLLVASGNCNAYSGIGDPYLPFRDVMGMLTGDVQGRWQAGPISGDHARRLWRALPAAARALLDHGPHLVPALLRGGPLLSRARAAAPGAPWVQRLGEQVERGRARSEGLEQSHLFQQATNMLCALAQSQPLLLILDDLQWADAASLGLLFHLGRRLGNSRILVAGAYRPEEVALGRQGERHPMEKVLAELKRTYGDVCLDLAGEEEGEGRRFVGALLATEPHRLGPGFQEALYRHTGGHPLFTIELLRAMQARGDLVQDGAGRWVAGPRLDWATLPARVEAVIEERVGRLEEDQRQVLHVACVEGEDFTAQVVARVQGVGERGLLRCLSRDLERRHRLVRGRGVQQVGALRLSRYRFAHALFQQYLYDTLDPGERRLLHGEIAAALEALYKGQAEVVAVQLAHHYGRAGEDRRALAYLALAADGALAAYANGEAEGYYRRALALAPADPERAHLLAGLGEALSRQSRFEEAIQAWREGIGLYESLGDPDGVAYLYARSAAAAWDDGDPARGLRLSKEGFEVVANAPESPGLALLLRELGRAYYFAIAGYPERARPLCEQALQMAERLGAVEVQAYTLVTLGILPDQSHQQSLLSLEQAVELAEGAGLLRAARHAHNNLAAVWMALKGNLWISLQHAERAAALACKEGNITDEVFNLSNIFHVALGLGDLKKAEASYERMCEYRSEFGDFGRSAFLILGCEAQFRAFRGEWVEAARLMRVLQTAARQLGDRQHLRRVGLGLARVLLESRIVSGAPQGGEWYEAEQALVEAVWVNPWSQTNRCHLSVVQTYQGKLDLAEETLAEARATAAPPQDFPQVKVWLLWAEAVLAAAKARWPEALAAYDSLVQNYGQTGRRWERARVLVEWADAHSARGEPGDRERAEELLREAEAEFEAMGAPVYVERVRGRLEEMGAGSSTS